MPLADPDLRRTIRLIAAAIATTVAVSLPLGYWLVAHSYAAQATAIDSEAHANMVTERINTNPTLWRYEIPRLDAIAATHLARQYLPEKHFILDEHGSVLVQSTESLTPRC